MLSNYPNSNNLTLRGGGFNLNELTIPLQSFTEYEPDKYFWPNLPTDLASADPYLLQAPPFSGLLLVTGKMQLVNPPPGLRCTLSILAISVTGPNTFVYLSTVDLNPALPNGASLCFAGPISLEFESFITMSADFAGIGAPPPTASVILSDVSMALIS